MKHGECSYSRKNEVRLTCERRAEFVRWIAESLRPFSILKDRGLVALLKTGRPYDYWMPSPKVVAKDTITVWEACRGRIIDLLLVSVGMDYDDNGDSPI